MDCQPCFVLSHFCQPEALYGISQNMQANNNICWPTCHMFLPAWDIISHFPIVWVNNMCWLTCCNFAKCMIVMVQSYHVSASLRWNDNIISHFPVMWDNNIGWPTCCNPAKCMVQSYHVFASLRQYDTVIQHWQFVVTLWPLHSLLQL
jgi:hypothetical protein